MATTTDLRGTVLSVVQEVEDRMSYSISTTLSARRTTKIMRQWLNDVVADISDFGDWPQLFTEVQVTAQTSVLTYEINASAPVKNIYEISFQGQRPAMWPRDHATIRQLQRTSSQGTPRQYAFVQTSGVNPKIGIDRMPGTSNNGKVFTAAVYLKPPVYTTADATVIPPFSSRLLVTGVHAKALLDENGGAPTPQYQTEMINFTRMLREEWNRSGADTGGGTDIVLVPRV